MKLRRVLCGCLAVTSCLLVASWGPLAAEGQADQSRKKYGADDLNGTLLVEEPTPAGMSIVRSFPGGGGTHAIRKLMVGDRVLVQFSYNPMNDPIKSVEVEYHQAGPETLECVDVFSSNDAVFSPRKGGKEETQPTRYYVVLLKAKRGGRCDLSILAKTESGQLRANPLLFDVRK